MATIEIFQVPEEKSTLFHPKYRPDIDGLRALAVVFVIVYHTYPSLLKGGFIGVDIFFVISGYLISTILFKSFDQGTFSLTNFYIRRIRRILPALTLVLFACLAFGWFALLHDELRQLGLHALGGSTFISNLMLWRESGYFDNTSETKPLLHLWSLGIEEQFYILWPILLIIGYKFRTNLLFIGLFVLVPSLVLSLYLSSFDSVAAFYSPLSRFWELMVGSIIAWINLYRPKLSLNENRLVLANISSILGLLLIAIGVMSIDKTTEGFPGRWALLPVLGAAFIIFAGPDSWANKNFLSNKVAIFIGLISYPLYLWHWPILTFTRIVNSDKVPSHAFRFAALLVIVFLSWLTAEVVEKPFRYGSKNPKFKVLLLICAVVMTGLIGLGFNLYDSRSSHAIDTLTIKRKSFEHGIGYSLNWIEGKEKWLFLGNAYENTIAKLKSAIVPDQTAIDLNYQQLSDLARTAAEYNTKVVLFLGPDKPRIYPEYLPSAIPPSNTRYVDHFLKKLKNVPNLIVYDPTLELIERKKGGELLYWRADTHWNNLGAYTAFQVLQTV